MCSDIFREVIRSCSAGIMIIEATGRIRINEFLRRRLGIATGENLDAMDRDQLTGVPRALKMLEQIALPEAGDSLERHPGCSAFNLDGVRYDVSICRFGNGTETGWIAFLVPCGNEMNDSSDDSEQFRRQLFRMSHDLKAPVRAIRNLTEWIREETEALDLPKSVEEYLEMLQSSSRELNQRIESYVSKYRSEVGRSDND
ncbi:MAG TPA: hypothetical protein PLV45_05525 [bacterium]|nr:hypothetical protein [bacterium]